MGVLDRFRLDGRTALVTGGGTGIGRGLARALAEAGADVAVCGRTPATLERTAADIESLGVRAKTITADVTCAADVRTAVQTVVDDWGGLDIAVNNAGITTWVDAVEMSEADWDSVMDTNLKGVFLCSQEAARVMIPRRRGAIVNVASISAQIINRPQRQAHYSASKAGVVHLTRALAAEWAEHGVRGQRGEPGLHPDRDGGCAAHAPCPADLDPGYAHGPHGGDRGNPGSRCLSGQRRRGIRDRSRSGRRRRRHRLVTERG